MIAPGASLGKTLLELSGRALMRRTVENEGSIGRISSPGCDIFDQRNHGFVRRIIMQPHFRQSGAKLDCEVCRVASRPGLDCIPDSSAPQPPGVRTDRARGKQRISVGSVCWCCVGRPIAGLFYCAAGCVTRNADEQRIPRPINEMGKAAALVLRSMRFDGGCQRRKRR